MDRTVDTTFPEGNAGAPKVGEAFTSLTQMAFEAAGGMDAHIRLNFGMRSSKYITYNLDSDKPWCIENEVDDSHQDLTDAELWTHSNIGDALDKGVLIFDGRG